MKTPIVLVSLSAAFCFSAFASDPILPLKDNDTWVLVGDSITAQRLHSNYIEAFFHTRYPQLRLHFRNSGVGGNRTTDVIARFDYDVAAWKPTIVSVELGMNDVNGGNQEGAAGVDGYVAGMKKLADNIRAINAKPLLISSSPIADGSLMNSWVSDRCRRLQPFTEALKELAKQESVPVIDQYNPLLNLWGPNKILFDAASVASRARLLKPEDQIPEYQTLQNFAKAWEGKPTGISLGLGDAIHVGPVGQYTMAATILTALNVDREVSSVTLTSSGAVSAQVGCKITEVSSKDGKLAFTRLDERMPWPLLPIMADALKLMPEIADLSRYTLTVSGLDAGKYRVSMNGTPVATLTHDQLAKGWNMSTLTEGPLAERATRILALIADLQGPYVNTIWREASKNNDPVKLDAMQKKIETCDAKIHEASQPQPIRFEIDPVY